MRKIYSTILFTFLIFNSSTILSQNFWQQTGLTSGEVESMITTFSNHIIAGLETPGSILVSTDMGVNWTQTFIGFSIVALEISPNATLFAGTENSGVLKSTDNGNSWIQTGLSGNISVYSFAVNQSNHIFAGRYSQGISRSTDSGDTWELVSTGLPSAPIYSLVINSDQHIYAGTKGFGVYKSINNGDNWIQSGLQNTFIKSLLINNLGYIFAGSDSGRVFRSTDDGVSWTLIHSGLNTSLVHCLAMNMSNGTLFEGTWNNGVFYSTDNGNNWTQINSGLTDLRVRSFTISSDGFLFAGTRGSGIFMTVNSTSPVENDNIKAFFFSLEQNYPNPFNPSTMIKFQITERSFVTLKIYDLLGNEISTLVNEEKQIGNYNIDFNASSLPSGVYFYLLRAGNFGETKKMMLIK